MQTIFVSKGSNRYSLQIKPEGKQVIGNEVIPIPAVLVAFEGGTYSTSDQKEIDVIRSTEAFKAGRVFEVPVGEKAPKPKLPSYTRGALDTASIHKEAGAKEPEESGLSLKEKGISKCTECPKEFTEDYNGRKLHGHMISHRRELREAKVEEK